MDVIIGPSITNNNTSITNIKINNIEYDIIKNSTYYYIISSMQKKDIIDNINIILSNTFIKNIQCLIDIIIKTNEKEYESYMVEFDDKYYIFDRDIHTKCKMNTSLLFNNFNSRKQEIENFEMIPKDILLNKKQLYTMILSEIEKVNTNMSYPHYIYCNNDDIMDLSFRFVYLNNGEVDSLGHKMDIINMKHGYNYFEFNLKLSMLYPFMPPTINYIKPQIDIDLISNIYNMELWNPTYWNRAITFDHIISNLGKALEPHFNKYLNIENNPFEFIELKMVELLYISKVQPQNVINISIGIDVIKSGQPDIKSSKTVWKSGTGYGSRNDDTWDISTYINMINSNNTHIINIIDSITSYIDNIKIDYIINPSLYKYILTKLTGINLLNLNTDIHMFQSIINLINKLSQKEHTDLYINFAKNIINNKSIKDLIDQIKLLMKDETIKSIEEEYIALYLYLIDTYDIYKNIVSKYAITILESIPQDEDIMSQYVRMVKDNMFDMLELCPSHRYYKNKQNIISPKTIIRIMSELSQLKNDLPVNWDSSVVLRYIPTNTNMITFIISGPKDTPYHNALFEFHAYFPNGYPTEIPLVNINTTGNGKVRFNPNLYACGKVCLSLLGTWSGSKGESWLPNISTFNQVIISIQSLILVDEPFYNEPGYEQKKDDQYIKDQSFIYNDNIRFQSVKYGMIEMIKKPLTSYETFIKQHFKFKKDEIITTVEKWVKESRIPYFADLFVELKKVLNEI
jgi:ubiquitin-protein ligase